MNNENNVFPNYPLSHLAYIGDAVYELLARELLLREECPAQELTERAFKIVCAEAQAARAKKLEGVLTPFEADIMRRGRNAKLGSRPKHATVAEYNFATGLECVFGWLWLSGMRGRAEELFDYQ